MFNSYVSLPEGIYIYIPLSSLHIKTYIGKPCEKHWIYRIYGGIYGGFFSKGERDNKLLANSQLLMLHNASKFRFWVNSCQSRIHKSDNTIGSMYGICANMTGIYWWDPCYHIYSSTMDPMGSKLWNCHWTFWRRISPDSSHAGTTSSGMVESQGLSFYTEKRRQFQANHPPKRKEHTQYAPCMVYLPTWLGDF